ncbi:MAG: hypothetical protein JSR77_08830 [Planctomycetes bacterium]|nr:hypothetical protein [Planctomycetota bacterium]
MDAIDTIGAGSGTAKAGGFSSVTSEQFSKIIFTELSRQDPLAPNDTNALLQQISTLRSIQADTDLTDRLKSLVTQNQFASATGMIGKRVSGVSEENERVSDLVSGVTRTDNGPILTLASGARMRMSNLDQVLATPPAGDSLPAGGGR